MATSTFVEIVPQDASGARIAAPVFLSFIDGLVLDSGMIASHFRPDFTYFMYRAKGIWWPGYVLPLKAGENWLFLKDDVAAVESSPKISNLFLSSPGAAIVGGFHDGTVGDQPVRKLTFTDGTTAFLYGWYHGYLILCTSEAGMREALGRLY